MPNNTNPKDLSDAEIEQKYREVWSDSISNYRVEIAANLLSVEMNRRLIDATNRSSHVWTKISLSVSFLALVFAFISATFSYIDWRQDEEWQKNQLTVLQNINKQLHNSINVSEEKTKVNLNIKNTNK